MEPHQHLPAMTGFERDHREPRTAVPIQCIEEPPLHSWNAASPRFPR